MSNTIETARRIARMTAIELANATPAARFVYRDYATEFGPGRTGDTVNVRAPVRFAAQSGPTLTAQNIQDRNIPLVVNRQPGVLIPFSRTDAALRDEELAARFARPAARAIAEDIETATLALARSVPNYVGTPGQNISRLIHLLSGAARIRQLGAPQNERFGAFLSPLDHINLASDQSRLGADGASASALRQGATGNIAGMDIFETNLLLTHQFGARGGTPVVAGAGQVVTYAVATAAGYTSTLNISGGSNSITNWARAGDVFTIANVFAVNPVTGATLPFLRQFVVTADANTSGTGTATLTVSPPIIDAGAYRTVSAAPANTAALTFVGTAGTSIVQNVVMHPNAMALATIPLVEPMGAPYSASQSYQGFTVSVTGDYDAATGVSRMRLEMLYGVQLINPELAVRVNGETV